MFPINWLKQFGTPFVGSRCAASKPHNRFKPHLEVLEGRDLPSVAMAMQDLGSVIQDYIRVVGDYNRLNADQTKLTIDQWAVSRGMGNSANLSQAQQVVAQDRQTLTTDQAKFSQDFSYMLLNLSQPSKDISPPPPPTPQSTISWARLPIGIQGGMSLIDPFSGDTVDGTTFQGTTSPDAVTFSSDGAGGYYISGNIYLKQNSPLTSPNSNLGGYDFSGNYEFTGHADNQLGPDGTLSGPDINFIGGTNGLILISPANQWGLRLDSSSSGVFVGPLDVAPSSDTVPSGETLQVKGIFSSDLA